MEKQERSRWWALDGVVKECEGRVIKMERVKDRREGEGRVKGVKEDVVC